MTTRRYESAGYHLPAPVALVELRRAEGERTVADVPMLLDTGADVSLIPRAAVEYLGLTAEPGSAFPMLGFDGTRSTSELFVMEVLFAGKSFGGPYPLTDREQGILGRDVLNQLTVTFDGPAQTWRVEPRANVSA